MGRVCEVWTSLCDVRSCVLCAVRAEAAGPGWRMAQRVLRVVPARRPRCMLECTSTASPPFDTDLRERKGKARCTQSAGSGRSSRVLQRRAEQGKILDRAIRLICI